MDKKLLKEFAMKARESLTSIVRAEIQRRYAAEDFEWIQKGEQYEAIVDKVKYPNLNLVLPKIEKERFDSLHKAIKAEGINAIVEKAAYTWFNRIIAIRYMELNEILPQGKHNEWLGIRVLSDSDDNPDPDILKASNLRRGDLDLPKVNIDNLLKLTREDEKFKEVLLSIVRKLGTIIPDVFGGETENIDFLLPNNLLGAGGFVNETLKLPAECFDRVEVIGWLYQYYNQAEKDIAMKKKSAVEKDEIPFVTQIFTPDWIVRYMVENSLGRYWLEHGGDESLAKNWKYLIKNSDSAQADTKKLPNIEQVTFIDPCAGSGHILVYAFEVFYQIYLSLGYAPATIPEKILTHNLYGLDIDDRAKQLSILSALLLARSYDKDIFKKPVRLNITSVAESNGMSGLPALLKGESRDIAEYLVDTFRDAKEYGSILKVKRDDYSKLREQLDTLAPLDKLEFLARTEQLIHQAEILSDTYTIAVTNPPYMQNKKFNTKLKTYVNVEYADNKDDLCSIFIDVLLNLISSDGILSSVTMQSWMFLVGQEDLRRRMYSRYSILNLLHLGTGAFEEMSGEVISTVAFTIVKATGKSGVVVDVTDIRDSKNKEGALLKPSSEISDRTYVIKSSDFLGLPSSEMAYKMTPPLLHSYVNGMPLRTIAKTLSGLETGNNNKYTRLWFEVLSNKISTSPTTVSEMGGYWYLYNKGGEYRKWYGRLDTIATWGIEGNFYSRLQGSKDYFKNRLSWTLVSTKGITFRYDTAESLFDRASPSILVKDGYSSAYVQGLLNSVVIARIASIMTPTINYTVAQVKNFPIIQSAKYHEEVIRLVEENRELSRADWDSFETSWDFEKHPLLPTSGEKKLADTYHNWESLSETRWNKLKTNEERLNEIFIEVYGMQDELTPEVEDKYVTVRKAKLEREAKSLLSYFVGVVFGRYSLDKPGLNFAGGEWKGTGQSALVDADNIVPIMDGEFYTDDIIKKLRDFLVAVYGESTLHANMDWLANAIGRRTTDNAEDTLRRYFVNDFFADHFREYGKRPIYWLLTSGKNNGFKALFYLHRYQPNHVATVRTQYLLNTQNIYTKRLAELEAKSTLNNDELKLKNDLITKLAEIKTYDALIAVAASKNVALALDDGVKTNYPKLSQCADDVKPGSEILEMKGVKL